MPELIQQRTMERPGQGIVPPGEPTKEHQEYPKRMRHPGFAQAEIGEEIKSPHGFTYHKGGKPIRYPDVLVHSASQEEGHAALGYVSLGKSSADAFAAAVASSAPPIENHVAIEYPKWVNGKLVKSAEEELAARPASSEVTKVFEGIGPSLNTEVNVMEVWPAVSGAAAVPVAPTKTTEQIRIEYLEGELAKLKAEMAVLIAATQDHPSINSLMVNIKENTRENGEPPVTVDEIEKRPFPGSKNPTVAQDREIIAAEKLAKSTAIKAGIAAGRARRMAAAAQALQERGEEKSLPESA